MSLSSAKIRDHAVIEQFRTAGPPRLPKLPTTYARRPSAIHSWVFSSSYWPRSMSGPLRPREKWRVSA
jgi:hypothetical protein